MVIKHTLSSHLIHECPCSVDKLGTKNASIISLKCVCTVTNLMNCKRPIVQCRSGSKQTNRSKRTCKLSLSAHAVHRGHLLQDSAADQNVRGARRAPLQVPRLLEPRRRMLPGQSPVAWSMWEKEARWEGGAKLACVSVLRSCVQVTARLNKFVCCLFVCIRTCDLIWKVQVCMKDLDGTCKL